LFLITFSQLHSCSDFVSFSVRFVKALAHISKSEKIGYLIYLVSFIILSFLKVIFTALSISNGSKVAKSYSLSTSIANNISTDVIFISNIILGASLLSVSSFFLLFSSI